MYALIKLNYINSIPFFFFSPFACMLNLLFLSLFLHLHIVFSYYILRVDF